MIKTGVFLILLLAPLLLGACQETTYTLLIEVEGEGETIPFAGQKSYEDKTALLLEASPREGWRFLRWSGPVANERDGKTSLIIQEDQVVTAIFVREEEVEWLTSLSLGKYNPLLFFQLLYREDTLLPTKIGAGWDPIERLLKIWLSSVRPYTSPYLYWLFRRTIYREGLPDKWEQVRELDKEAFGEKLMELPFLMDFGSGALDFSPEEKGFFFLEREYNRDCDNWARMWFWWAEHRQYPAWEIAIIDGYDVTTAHMITVFKDEEGYNLCNYKVVGQYSSLEEAVLEFRYTKLTSSGVYENLRWAIYQESIP